MDAIIRTLILLFVASCSVDALRLPTIGGNVSSAKGKSNTKATAISKTIDPAKILSSSLNYFNNGFYVLTVNASCKDLGQKPLAKSQKECSVVRVDNWFGSKDPVLNAFSVKKDKTLKGSEQLFSCSPSFTSTGGDDVVAPRSYDMGCSGRPVCEKTPLGMVCIGGGVYRTVFFIKNGEMTLTPSRP